MKYNKILRKINASQMDDPEEIMLSEMSQSQTISHVIPRIWGT